MMKIGDRFKDKTTGKIYIIRMEIDNDTLCLIPRSPFTCQRTKSGSEMAPLFYAYFLRNRYEDFFLKE
jgi:hypothetical protein